MAVAKVALHTNEGMGCMAKSHYDKIAVISGGANGIGQAFAQRLAHEGAHIVIADVASGSDTVKMVEQAGRPPRVRGRGDRQRLKLSARE